MATSILLRSARSALRSKGLLPATGATACTAMPLGRRLGTVARLFSSIAPNNSASTVEFEDKYRKFSRLPRNMEDEETTPKKRFETKPCPKTLDTRCLPATDAADLAVLDEILSSIRLLQNSEHDASSLTFDEYHEALKVTDDIVNSEEKLRALFDKWLLINTPHFDVGDKHAFKERFEIFKGNARLTNEYNNRYVTSTCGVNCFADLTPEECATVMCGTKDECLPEGCVKNLEKKSYDVRDKI